MPFNETSLDSPYPQGIAAQTRQVLKNLQTVWLAAVLDCNTF